MAQPLAPLRSMARAIAELRGRVTADRLSAFDWTVPQAAFLEEARRFKLFRTGNQIGKTTIGLAECVLYALGRHPRQRFPPPVEIWILFDSRTQSLPLQEKLAKLLSPVDLHPDQRPYNPVTGFGHHEPIVRFRNGSLIRIKTVRQGGIGIAGGTVHHILLDEPPTERVFAECQMRLRATGGTMSLTLTPINRDCEFLRKLVEGDEGRTWADLHFKLTPENMIQVRSGLPRVLENGRICDTAWVDEVRAEAIPHEAPIVNDGEWEMRATDRFYDCFVSAPGVEGSHLGEPPPDLDLVICVGVDHGTGANQAGVLLGVKMKGRNGWPTIYILEETLAEGPTTSEQDGKELLSMLQRRGLQWRPEDLRDAFGDIPTGRKGAASRKGNRDLEEVIRRELGLASRRELRPPIAHAKRGEGAGAGAVRYGERWIYKRIAEGNFVVSPRCTKLIGALDKYDGTSTSEHKHLCDAMRYGLYKVIREAVRNRARGGTIGIR